MSCKNLDVSVTFDFEFNFTHYNKSTNNYEIFFFKNKFLLLNTCIFFIYILFTWK